MAYSELIHRYFDEGLDGSLEDVLFEQLARDEELRREFAEHARIASLVRADAAGLTPPAAVTASLFSDLGLAAAHPAAEASAAATAAHTAPAATASVVKIPFGVRLRAVLHAWLPQFRTAAMASIGTAVLVLLLLPRVGDEATAPVDVAERPAASPRADVTAAESVPSSSTPDMIVIAPSIGESSDAASDVAAADAGLRLNVMRRAEPAVTTAVAAIATTDASVADDVPTATAPVADDVPTATATVVDDAPVAAAPVVDDASTAAVGRSADAADKVRTTDPLFALTRRADRSAPEQFTSLRERALPAAATSRLGWLPMSDSAARRTLEAMRDPQELAAIRTIPAREAARTSATPAPAPDASGSVQDRIAASRVFVEMRVMNGSSDPAVDLPAPGNAIFRDMAVSAVYALGTHHALGVEYGRESFGQVYASAEQRTPPSPSVRSIANVSAPWLPVVYNENRMLDWVGAVWKLSFADMALFDAVFPYARTVVGATKDGPLGKFRIGLEYAPWRHALFNAGFEGSLLRYSVEGAWYQTTKTGVTVGLAVGL